MQIHHIGYLVDDIFKASQEFVKLGYCELGEISNDSAREIYILFMKNEEYIIELIQPINEQSPMYGLRKKYRNSPYHICYQTNNLQNEIDNMVNSGYTLLQPPQKATAIENCPDVAFLMNHNIGMIELVECNSWEVGYE